MQIMGFVDEQGHRLLAGTDQLLELALAFLAWAYEERLTRGWDAYSDDDKGAAIALARRAIAADRDDALVLAIAGFVLVMIARDYDRGLQATRRAHDLNPNVAFATFMIGAALLMSGDPEEGLVFVEKAIRVSPGDPGAFFFYTSAAAAHLMCGRPAEACELATRSAGIYDGWDTTYRVLASALVRLDRIDHGLLDTAAVGKNRTSLEMRHSLLCQSPEGLDRRRQKDHVCVSDPCGDILGVTVYDTKP